ncbi:DEAD/DEAH box helicase [Pseudacidobacterium ailaaui]|jgi:ATP-dependent Lhr-like helicase|uniref:DEAD/DEAH box helicase n=1 Tax=Pseudacidobacterium ailaaui TaxID=1382359 RepID=UPI000859746F|nr:DEAD/DEAH box helicase [Pseudacidobacterium ailaaui]
MQSPSVPESLAWAHPVVQEWFVRRFGTPTEPQEQGWPHILAGRPVLISAPTGSGKTLAAFLICIDQLIRKALDGRLEPRTEVVYVSPLKALSNDVQKNLEAPLKEIQQLALERGHLGTQIRAAVRTGDTLPAERQRMLKQPPHILVTTPESLYIMLTAEKSRNNLRHVHTVIVDEVHAMADDKRGAHLALTLERLDALVRGENRLSVGEWVTGHKAAPQRIGLSATQNPIELVAEFLRGGCESPVEIVQVGRRRDLDLAVEVPDEELGAVASNSIWDGIYKRLAELALAHRSTLVFVNTRRMVERIAFRMGELLGEENVAAHHGSLSRKLRLEAERKLKQGEIRLLVATASLELGIDIGNVDLVCQINSPRAIAVAIQRVGRAGHWRGAIPKGRFFATTRDDLLEQAATIRAIRAGALDRLEVPPKPLDVLMQQIVAACAAEPWEEDTLFAVLRRAQPYHSLTREEFDEILCLLTEGIEASRGRYGSYLLRDRVRGRVQARRGSRTIAVSNAGTIPDTALYAVIAEPEGVQIATLDEDFAVESSAGDIILLGNTSWRVERVESAGRVLVSDAQGQPPTVPFWRGEAPQRTDELSQFVSDLREEIDRRTKDVLPGYISQAHPQIAETVSWLKQECGVCDSGAEQMIAYIAAGRSVLGVVPSLTTIVAERFFDEGGGMQLVIHAPFGGRINKAWGLALRKRFCRGFNFELQAAATDNGLNISLAEQHSFPLSDVFQFLTEQTVTELLEQASLASPIFKSRWKWAAGRSLQLLRYRNGKRIPPQIQRTRGDDLLASVFPQVAACFENIEGDIEVPDHPLIREVMKDVLGEAMDLEGLKRVLAGMHSGKIRCVAVDTATPSHFAHEMLNANPYAYLDDAPLEERRARAVNMRGILPDHLLGEAGRLSPEAIASVREEIWPDVRDEHEFHDLLCSLIIVPAEILCSPGARDWDVFFSRLERQRRATLARTAEKNYLCAAERMQHLRLLFPAIEYADALDYVSETDTNREEALRRAIQGWMAILGPVTCRRMEEKLGIAAGEIWKQMLRLEMNGTILRGVFEGHGPLEAIPDEDVEWCERRLLQRIHKRTLVTLRRQIEPVSASVFMQWLLRWQHLAPCTQLSGESGLLEALRQLEGFEAPAIEWERSILPQRVSGYDPRWLDALCLSGAVGWGRISPHPAFHSIESGGPRRVVPTSMAPVTFFIREEAFWMDRCLTQRQIPENCLAACLSGTASKVREVLLSSGAMFAGDLVRRLGISAAEIDMALWELVAAGLVTADGFDSLRMLIDPRRNLGRRTKQAAGRWSLFRSAEGATPVQRENEIESACRVVLRRYGVVFRDLLERETTMPRWRDLLGSLRRMEARGQVRGGRFVQGFHGEQFALPEALDSLREARREGTSSWTVNLAAADPMNLIGIVLPGERIAAVAGNRATLDENVWAPLQARNGTMVPGPSFLLTESNYEQPPTT